MQKRVYCRTCSRAWISELRFRISALLHLHTDAISLVCAGAFIHVCCVHPCAHKYVRTLLLVAAVPCAYWLFPSSSWLKRAGFEFSLADVMLRLQPFSVRFSQRGVCRSPQARCRVNLRRPKRPERCPCRLMGLTCKFQDISLICTCTMAASSHAPTIIA